MDNFLKCTRVILSRKNRKKNQIISITKKPTQHKNKCNLLKQNNEALVVLISWYELDSRSYRALSQNNLGSILV